MEGILITIAVSILVGIILLIIEYRTRWFARLKPTEPNLGSESESDDNPDGIESRPSPNEIMNQISSLPPYQRDNARKQYVGLKVRWKARYDSVISTGSRKTKILMLPSDRATPTIVGVVDVAKYPELKIVESGRVLMFSGKISSIDQLTIWLNEIELKILG